MKGDYSLLFDTDRLAWVAWWHGGFLNRTKSGRLWEWHPEGPIVWANPRLSPPLVFQRTGKNSELVRPETIRERYGSFREVVFDAEAMILKYELRGPDDTAVLVTERVEPISRGWRRHVTAEGLSARHHPLILLEVPENFEVSKANRSGSWHVDGSTIVVQPVGEPAATDPLHRILSMNAMGEGRFEASLDVRIEMSPDR